MIAPEIMQGETLVKITGMEAGSAQIDLFTASDKHFSFWHHRDCCEEVTIEDVIGNVDDLLNMPLLIAREDMNTADTPHPGVSDSSRYIDSYTWTFYNFSTVKGHVTVRWLGESNGYYSESVSFDER